MLYAICYILYTICYATYDIVYSTVTFYIYYRGRKQTTNQTIIHKYIINY